MIDERRGVPSASELPLLDLCIASHKMKQAAPKRDAGAAAEHGNDVHGILSDDISPDDVSYSAAETAEMCEEQAQRLVEQMFGDDPVNVVKEIRLGITATGRVIPVLPESRATFVFTGKFDALFHRGGEGLLVDYKSLHGDHSHAMQNMQLAGLAVMVWEFWKLTKLRVALVQPWKGKPTVAEYGPEDIAAAKAWLMDKLAREKVATPDDRTPGPHCHKCDAITVCDKAHAWMADVVEAAEPLTLPADSKALFAATVDRALRMPAKKLAALVASIPTCGAVLSAIKETAKIRADTDDDFKQYYTLKEKRGQREITGNGQEVFNVLAPLGLTADDMMAAASYSICDLQESVRKRSGIKSVAKNGAKKYNLTGTEAATAMESALGPLLGRKAATTELVPTKSIE